MDCGHVEKSSGTPAAAVSFPSPAYSYEQPAAAASNSEHVRQAEFHSCLFLRRPDDTPLPVDFLEARTRAAPPPVADVPWQSLPGGRVVGELLKQPSLRVEEVWVPDIVGMGEDECHASALAQETRLLDPDGLVAMSQ